MQALVTQLTPFVPVMGLFGTAIVATCTATYLATNRIAGNELKGEMRDAAAALESLKRDKEREAKEAAAALESQKRDKEREAKEAAAALESQKKEAAAELERVRSLKDLELKVERASSANTNLVIEFLFRGDFSPMREALQAKQAAASAAAASAASEPAAAPVDQVLK
jgi:hypothetical protein